MLVALGKHGRKHAWRGENLLLWVHTLQVGGGKYIIMETYIPSGRGGKILSWKPTLQVGGVEGGKPKVQVDEG